MPIIDRDRDSAPAAVAHRRMFIAGDWADASTEATMESIDPTTEDLVATFPDAGEADVARAVEAAQEALPSWAGRSWQARAAVLRELADRIEDCAEELAQLDVKDSGNPINGMRADARSAPDDLRYYAGLAGEVKGDTIPAGAGALAFTERSPYGVVGRIIPFNHPLKFAAGKVAAPLAAGNAVILKPSEQAPLSALRLAEIAEDLFPAGIFSVLTGGGATAGAALTGHPGVPRIAFTGSVPTGRAIYRAGAEDFKHVSLELGGKNPIIILPDVDLARAAKAAVASMNLARSSGQSCGSTSRLFVHSAIYDAFVSELVGVIDALRIGDPADEGTDVGPMAFRAHYEKVMGYIDAGRSEGAKLLAGGGRPAGRAKGFFVEPTVFADVDDRMTIAREEIFGPLMSVLRWTDIDDVIRRANDSEFGLTANIWTNDFAAAHRLARAVEAGYVYINGKGRRPAGTPFGGWKHSGTGKENSLEELLSYTREKTVFLDFESPVAASAALPGTDGHPSKD